MNILHYTLGLPPFRTGGLTKYSLDLMISEENQGNKISILYPGYMTLSNKVKIVENKKYNGYKMNIYELVNPLPVTLMSGVRSPEKYFKRKIDEKLIYDFFKTVKPDIIHLHTLMGIYKEFIEVAKTLKIPIIYSTHDYFGICPKVNLLTYKKGICNKETYDEGRMCAYCNKYGYSEKLIYVMQSKIYRKFKYSSLVKALRRYKKNKPNSNAGHDDIDTDADLKKIMYYSFRKYYLEILKNVSYFHFNSSVSKDVFNKYLKCKGEVLHITHCNISDNRKVKKFGDKLRLTYIGPTDEYKGFNLLIESIKRLNSSGINNWILNVYGDDGCPESIENVKFNGKYDYGKLSYIYENTDLLVIPSIWNETFGFIGLEAVSYGVPIVVTKNVGFKDIVEENEIGIVTDADSESISNVIGNIIKNKQVLYQLNKNIINMNFNFNMTAHSKNICDLYRRIIESR